MNNEQFRRLLADNSSSAKSGDKSSSSSRNAAPGSATPGGGLLGSRMRSSIPMTPRAVNGVDFARQLAEQRREGGDRPTKRFKSSAAPKGSKLPAGYQDRAQLRNAEEEGDDISKRIKALEDMVKLGQIDQATFEKLRKELGVGGDTGSTHMVKGLDWALLRRARAGEDVSQAPEKPEPAPADDALVGEDADEAFERLMEERGLEEVQAAPKEQKEKKKGTMAPPPARKKTRDEILQELKSKRAAASVPAPPPESVLGAKFKKLGDGKPEKKRFVETDESGRRREVLLITDAEGKTKRKTRWLDKPGDYVKRDAMPMPDKDATPLGMEVPAEIAARIAASAALEEDDDGDIFADVGADYNPLAGIEDEDDSSSDEDGEAKDTAKAARKEEKASAAQETQKPGAEAPSTKPRNYFATASSSTAAEEQPEDRSNPLTKDPTILAALKRAAALRQASPSGEDGGESIESSLRQKKFLEEARRRDAMDAADMDIGFGGSRNEDDEDEDAVLLEFEDRGAKKRKRGPKKKKGGKDSVDDVMRVLEGRQKKSG
ncbi:hypothetical protein N7486_007336 [Penicillium sp. IBT 16267x]|nr:hypothetical protein N7486_007336 [Penicillium sp. IBT 16267x]